MAITTLYHTLMLTTLTLNLGFSNTQKFKSGQ